MSVPGFYDGAGRYKVRFMPSSPGEWHYETKSSAPELNGQSGTFSVTRLAANNHGPVQVFKTFYLRYADGTAYHQFGTTCYAWVHQTRELQDQTLQTLAASPFNKIRFCVFPKSYAYNKNEPELFAFAKQADGKFDFDQPDPAFWQHFERRILDLQRLGIEADIILWHPYDRWGFASMSDEQDDRYLRYCIARLSAFRNVWWSLANEYDFMTDQPREGHKGNKQWDDWDRFFALLEKEDPHQRLRGIHNGSKWYDHTKSWVTHASLQTSDMNGGVRYRAQYQKPVLYDECKYEGNIRQGWGQLSAREMTQRFWLGTLSGCYVGHGETYQHPEDILWWAKGGTLRGESPPRIQWLKDLMAQSPPFEELQPLGDDQGRFLLAKPAEYYLLYALDERTQGLELAGHRPYKVDALDPWEMREWPVGTARPGKFSIAPPKGDLVYRFVPYQPGERLRPEAQPAASLTEGTPPLTVQFTCTSKEGVRWDFGDGETSTSPSPSHTYNKPGIYSVALTVTDREGGRAENHLQIAVDRNSREPMVRVGFESEETPVLKLHGTAVRKPDGSLHLPSGEPWGWADATEDVVSDLSGLRSFTISGWLRPDSLEAGSGGNRIFFCLNHDRSGIDLVSRADGRLRLAVNQWADLAKSATSKGGLTVGKWTFFAVTYDSARERDNVCWYLSAPQDSPDRDAALTLDRKATYNLGPVAKDIGPLTVGNFNQTMRGYGLDRQFRGSIHNLQISGSRLGGRGVLSLDTIKERMQ